MNSVKEFIALIDDKLEKMGDNRNNMLMKLGLSKALLRATETRDTFPSVSNVVDIAEYIGIPIGTLLGTDKDKSEYDIPDDINTIVTMLLKIPEKDRNMIQNIVKLYYKESQEI